jgi:Na+/proline symporter
MNEIRITWENILPVWWSFYWRATIFGLIAGAIVGALAGFVLGAMNKPELIPYAGGIAGFVVGLPISIICLKIAFEKDFNGYKVKLISNEN